ncbi:hypothetical protein DRF62_04175 [Chryseobacterium piscium]|uniref:PIN domain-containing protein n=1 Tax=Chryseobacterium piscium TaxID=333702 RepID=A0A3D9BRW9_9FLAO|nr:hypothetical protein [Chryseobacterium piscium]REC56269.1 hypothetical protein DRF62_04175 [Chryseobacterium piscium]
MKQIYITDANIFIDLYNLGIVKEFLSLECELCTTDFVMEELEPEQAAIFSGLKIYESSEEEIEKIVDLMDNHTGLSFEDCSVWYFADKTQGVLITSDGKLRKTAFNSGTDVRGILHLFEKMKDEELLSIEICIEKLELLKTVNVRSPKKLIDNLIDQFKNEL